MKYFYKDKEAAIAVLQARVDSLKESVAISKESAEAASMVYEKAKYEDRWWKDFFQLFKTVEGLKYDLRWANEHLRKRKHELAIAEADLQKCKDSSGWEIMEIEQ